MSEQQSLEQILSSGPDKGVKADRQRDDSGRWVKSPAPTETKSEPTPVPEKSEAVAEKAASVAQDATSAPDPQPSAPPASPPQVVKDPVQGLQAGIAAEREKRQAAERIAEEVNAKLSALTEQFQQYMAQQQRPAPQPELPKPTVDIWDDPAAFTRQIAESQVKPLQERYEAQLWDLREQIARSRFSDYDDARDAFVRATQSDPQLARQLQQSKDPIAFAYEKGKELYAAEADRWRKKLGITTTPAAPTAQPAAVSAPPSLNAEPSPAAPPAVNFTPAPLAKALRNNL